MFWSGMENGITPHGCDLYGAVNFKLVSFLFSVNQKVLLLCCLQWHFTEASSETKVVVINGSKTSMIADRNQKEKGQDERVWEILQAHRFNILQRCFIFKSVWREAIVEQNPKPLKFTSNRTRSNFLSECICSFFLKTFIWFSKHFNFNWTKKVRNTK